MHPNVNDSPLHTSFLRPEITIFDTVYTPESTMLVKQARDRGCKVITGVDLFVRQAGGSRPPLHRPGPAVRDHGQGHARPCAPSPPPTSDSSVKVVEVLAVFA